MAQRNITVGEYYHVFNRGNHKQQIFHEDRDYVRFLFLILFLQSPLAFDDPGIYIDLFLGSGSFEVEREKVDYILNNRTVGLLGFCLMPNHFHLIVYEKQAGGISRYMQKVQVAYTKYKNAKHEISGHLFQGAFKSVHIKTSEQLAYLSAYIHLNPREVKWWSGKEKYYPWSSYQDYTTRNRWMGFLSTKIIMDDFSGANDYSNYVQKSGAKSPDLQGRTDS